MACWDDDHLFDRVAACLRVVAGGSGHLAGYDLDRSSFAVMSRDPGPDGSTAHTFVVEGARYGEFDGPETGGAPSVGSDASSPVPAEAATERLEGTVVLTASGEVAVDDEGRARLEPWRPVLRGGEGGGDGAVEDELDAWFAAVLERSEE